MQIILGSGSPRRKELLHQLLDTFSIITSDCEEKTEFHSPDQYVVELSHQKACNVCEKIKNTSCPKEDYLVIGSDTIVYLTRFIPALHFCITIRIMSCFSRYSFMLAQMSLLPLCQTLRFVPISQQANPMTKPVVMQSKDYLPNISLKSKAIISM